VTPLNLDGVSVEAFFDYKTVAKAGVALRTNLRAGLRSEKLLEKIIPGEAPTADANAIAVTLDTKDGLTFGEGPNRKITLPVRFSFPGIEVREMAIARPVGPDENSGRIDLMVTLAGKFGEVLGIVAEGGGVTIRWKGEPGAALEVLPKPPYAAGLRIKTGIVNGGGYLRYVDERANMAASSISSSRPLASGPQDSSALILSRSWCDGRSFFPEDRAQLGLHAQRCRRHPRDRSPARLGRIAQGPSRRRDEQILFPTIRSSRRRRFLDRLGKIFPGAARRVLSVGPIAELGWVRRRVS